MRYFGGNMKHLLNFIPFGLLLSLVPFFYYQEPNLAQSIIVAVVAGLCGFKYYQMDKQEPDYKKLYKKELDLILAEVNQIKSDYGKMTVAQNKEKRREQFKF